MPAACSPDGKQIAFCSGRSGAFEISAMKQNGTDQHQLLPGSWTGFVPAWQPRGAPG
jgi:Tol biopolymer transport system component